ncbi:MAG: hypothetical protein AAF889_00815 [Cyanobacteria bacterium P01_D01_bin.73]
MTNASLLSQAKQGDTQAIESLMNQALRPAGIQVRLLLFQSCLTVMAVAKKLPDRKFMVNFVRRGMGSLANSALTDNGLKQVLVQGFLQGDRTPKWQASLALERGKFVEVASETDQAPQNAVAATTARPGAHPADIPPQNPFPAEPAFEPSPPPPTPQPAAAPTSRPPRNRPKSLPISSVFKSYRRPSRTKGLIIGISGWLLSGAIALGLRLVVALLAETRVYTLPYAGELLQLLEVAELLTLVIFAVLGLGIGLSAIALPRKWGVKISALVLTLLVPAIFMAGPAVRYQIWLQQVSQAQQLTVPVAVAKTDRFLNNRVDRSGLLGFYVYTARYSRVPIAAEDMVSDDAVDEQVNSTIAGAARVSVAEVEKFLEWGTWGIRGFYFLVATFAAISHFRQAIALPRD